MTDWKLVRGFSSNSASPTDIWELEYVGMAMGDTPCEGSAIAKIYIDEDDTASKLLYVEGQIYQKITKKLIQKRGLPFFVKLCTFTRNVSLDQLSTLAQTHGFTSPWTLKTNLLANIKYMKGNNESRDSITADSRADYKPRSDTEKRITQKYNHANKYLRFGITITELVRGDNLKAWISPKPLKETITVLSLAFFAMFCLADIGINQNDLHWGNVLMNEYTNDLTGGTEFLVLFGGVLYRMKSPIIPMLYDLDRATERNAPESQMLLEDFGVEQYGNCPKFHPARDIVKGMCQLYRYCEKRAGDTGVEELRLFVASFLQYVPNIENYLKVDPGCYWSKGDGVSSYLCDNSVLDQMDTTRFVAQMLTWGSEESTPKVPKHVLKGIRKLLSDGSEEHKINQLRTIIYSANADEGNFQRLAKAIIKSKPLSRSPRRNPTRKTRK